MPVYSHKWVDVATADNKDALINMVMSGHRVVDIDQANEVVWRGEDEAWEISYLEKQIATLTQKLAVATALMNEFIKKETEK